MSAVRRHRGWTLVGAGLSLMLAGSACTTKSLDVEAAGTTESTVSVTEAPRESTTTTTSRPSTTTTPPAPGPSEPGLAPGALAGQCPNAGEMEALTEQFESFDPTMPPIDVMTSFMDLLAAYVPPELAADFDLMRTTLLQMLQYFSSLPEDMSAMTPEQLEDYSALFDPLKAREVEAASQRLEDYFVQTCPELNWSGSELESEFDFFG